jgi:hypothetical protein
VLILHARARLDEKTDGWYTLAALALAGALPEKVTSHTLLDPTARARKGGRTGMTEAEVNAKEFYLWPL